MKVGLKPGMDVPVVIGNTFSLFPWVKTVYVLWYFLQCLTESRRIEGNDPRKNVTYVSCLHETPDRNPGSRPKPWGGYRCHWCYVSLSKINE